MEHSLEKLGFDLGTFLLGNQQNEIYPLFLMKIGSIYPSGVKKHTSGIK
jgi:hypothetical protein